MTSGLRLEQTAESPVKPQMREVLSGAHAECLVNNDGVLSDNLYCYYRQHGVKLTRGDLSDMKVSSKGYTAEL